MAHEGKTLQVTVDAADHGQRLDRWLATSVADLSRSRLKSLIETGQVTRAGATINEPSLRVKSGQTFAIFVPETAPPEPEGQAIALTVVYEDEDIVVIDKPAGMVVHPAPGNPDRTLVNALIAHCGEGLKGVGGVRRPGIVHRLDKDTSGLLVAAKHDAAHRGLVSQFQDRSISRRYAAVVWGLPRPAEGEITGNIGRSPRNRKKMAVLSRGGRPATTRYRVTRSLAQGAASLLECRLLTGRTHQIRVHLADRGHPVIGDPVYGRADRRLRSTLGAEASAAVEALGRQALHAKSLSFQHPMTGDSLEFESPLPTDINNLISSLEL